MGLFYLPGEPGYLILIFLHNDNSVSFLSLQTSPFFLKVILLSSGFFCFQLVLSFLPQDLLAHSATRSKKFVWCTVLCNITASKTLECYMGLIYSYYLGAMKHDLEQCFSKHFSPDSRLGQQLCLATPESEIKKHVKLNKTWIGGTEVIF